MRTLIIGLLCVAGLLSVTHVANAANCPAVKEIKFRWGPETIPGRTIYEQYLVEDSSGKIIWQGEAAGPNFLEPDYQMKLKTPNPIANTCLYSYRESYKDDTNYPPQQAWRNAELKLSKQP
ncbi:hypothetical protein M1D68_02165 [Pseudomonas sp. R4-84]